MLDLYNVIVYTRARGNLASGLHYEVEEGPLDFKLGGLGGE